MKIMILVLSLTTSFIAHAASQATPEGLGELWIASINSRSPEKIRSLIHPKCPKNSINEGILKRMVSGPMPAEFSLETLDLGEKEVLRKIYGVLPEKQLNLKYITHSFEDRKKYGLGKGFPIGRIDGKWYFVICTRIGSAKN